MNIRYKVADEVLGVILDESVSKYPQETGGILIGRLEHNCLYIEHAAGPGPLAEHSLTNFRRDGLHSQMILDEIVVEARGNSDYIGEWHSHPAKCGPSPTDIAALRWIAKNPKYAVTEPIMALCIKTSKDCWEFRVYLFDGKKLRELKGCE